MKTLHDRYRQAQTEAKWTVALTLGYFVWWYASAYLIPDLQANALYFGLPLWFLLSCVIGPVVFTLLCAMMVKFIFKDISLEIEKDHLDE